MNRSHAAILVVAISLSACADSATGPIVHRVVNPYAYLGDRHNSGVAIAMLHAQQDVKHGVTAPDVLEKGALGAVLQYAPALEQGIRAHFGPQTHAMADILARLPADGGPTTSMVPDDGTDPNYDPITPSMQRSLARLDQVVQQSYAVDDIDAVDDAFDNFDAATMGSLSEYDAVPALSISAIAHASADYWYGQALNQLDPDEPPCGRGTGRRCPIPWQDVGMADYVGAGSSLGASALPCSMATVAWGPCVGSAVLGGAIGASVYQGVWGVFVGGGGGGGGGKSCASNEYVTYYRGSLICKAFTQ